VNATAKESLKFRFCALPINGEKAYSCLRATMGFAMDAFKVSNPTVKKVIRTMVNIAPPNTQMERSVW
jgi:hypothetical protein